MKYLLAISWVAIVLMGLVIKKMKDENYRLNIELANSSVNLKELKGDYEYQKLNAETCQKAMICVIADPVHWPRCK